LHARPGGGKCFVLRYQGQIDQSLKDILVTRGIGRVNLIS
jgi:hypothetical protein